LKVLKTHFQEYNAFIQFKEQLKDFTVFSLPTFAWRNGRSTCAGSASGRRKGTSRNRARYYVFSDENLDEPVCMKLQPHLCAFVFSFETALSYHGLIPETVFGVVSDVHAENKQV